MPDAATVRAGSSRRRPEAIALDFRSDGICASVSTNDGSLSFDLSRAGLAPSSLLTVKHRGEGLSPAFPSLLSRLGDAEVVTLSPAYQDKAHVLLASLLERVSAGLRAWWGDGARLAVVVSAFGHDLQRALIHKAAEASGWTQVRLVNKTTATAFHGVQGRPRGKYLVLTIGHSPAEGAVVEWDGQHLSTTAYSLETEVSGECLDRKLIERGFADRGQDLNLAGLGAFAWLWLRGRIESARQRLNFSDVVTMELAEGILGDLQEVRFVRSDLEAILIDCAANLDGWISRCCEESRTSRESLAGCLVTGSLLLHAPLLACLQEQFGSRLAVLPPLAQATGAARLAAVESVDAPEAEGRAARRVPRDAPIRVRLGMHDGSATWDPATHDVIDERRIGPTPVESGREKAQQELQDLKQRLISLEQSLGVDAPADPSAASHPGAVDERPGDRDARAVTTPPGDDAGRKSARRAFLRASEHIKKAEQLLKEGRIAEAVGSSHAAWSESQDPRIFRAMIEVHLRASRRRPPAIENFLEDRHHLLCALDADDANPAVKQAIVSRYRAHVEQLLLLDSEAARDEGRKYLNELLSNVEVTEDLQDLAARLGLTRARWMTKRGV